MEGGGGTGPHIQRRWNDESPSAATSRDAWRSPAGLSRLGRSRGYTGLETERSGPNVDINEGILRRRCCHRPVQYGTTS